ncbi:cbb3-type cytochrome c oxidase subunit I [Arthrobacter sp. NPDC055138]
MLNERLGKIHFWMLFLGFHTIFLIQHWLGFLIQHWLGVLGMPRRYADYLPEDGFTDLHQFSTIGTYLLGASMIPFLWNVYITWRNGKKVEVDDPWGFGGSLEWATSCPPPRRNFATIPRIRPERPALDLHHPELAPRFHDTSHSPADAPAGGRLTSGPATPKPPTPMTSHIWSLFEHKRRNHNDRGREPATREGPSSFRHRVAARGDVPDLQLDWPRLTTRLIATATTKVPKK